MNDHRVEEEICDAWVAHVGDDIARDLVDPFEVEDALALVKYRQTAAHRHLRVPATAPALPARAHAELAIDEIELCGDLMIAAASSGGDRLTQERIDEVLKVRNEDSERRPADSDTPAARGTRPD